jgi:hypothetical protein
MKIPLIVFLASGVLVPAAATAQPAAATAQNVPAATAPNATLEIAEAAINVLVARLGALSDSDVYQPVGALQHAGLVKDCTRIGLLDCPSAAAAPAGSKKGRIPLLLCNKPEGGAALVPGGASVPWQWWVTDAHFTLAEGSMTFTATVLSRVGDQTKSETRTAPASVGFLPGSNVAAINLSSTGPGGGPSPELVPDRLKVDIGPLVVPIQLDGDPVQTITQVDVAKLYRISIPIARQRISVPLPNGTTRTLTAHALSATPQYLAGHIVISIDVGF